MSDALAVAKQKDAIIETRGQSKVQAVGSKRYIVTFENGKGLTCIDLVGDPPEDVERGIREMFSHYGIKSIER